MNRLLVVLLLLTSLFAWQTTLADVTSGAEKDVQVDANEREKIAQWFKQYDQIRRDAEMTKMEKLTIGITLKKGLSVNASDGDLQKGKDFASRMVSRYNDASAGLAKLEAPVETQKLHDGYTKYFVDARALFEDYIKAQEDVVKTGVKDPECNDKRQALEALDHEIKEIDRLLREQYHIPSHSRDR